MTSIKQETENIEGSVTTSQDKAHAVDDLGGPQLATTEDNHEIAKKPSTATFIAIFVRTRTIQNNMSQLIFNLVSGLVYRISYIVRPRGGFGCSR